MKKYTSQYEILSMLSFCSLRLPKRAPLIRLIIFTFPATPPTATTVPSLLYAKHVNPPQSNLESLGVIL
ncbi:unnamed protein product [Pneumocystis jirovecii]|uniref:Uncharacterized protein n=1 Tax=Pneumocystis jirovecii TaxID=42068 RepID=L0PH35_PNEJI|nr:unnamed protein product [Pneumocystis jirovecii]